MEDTSGEFSILSMASMVCLHAAGFHINSYCDCGHLHTASFDEFTEVVMLLFYVFTITLVQD